MAKQLSSQILEYIDQNNETNSLDLSTELGQPHDLVIGAIKSLQTFDNVSLPKVFAYCYGLSLHFIFNSTCALHVKTDAQ